MLTETEIFFDNLIREDRSIMDLYTADYTFVNERLARHYGIPDVAGERFRRVDYLHDERRGILGHGSILTLTSHAGRTSPVLRGKWVMEVLLGTPPPPPPPDVPELEEEAVGDGRFLTVRERLEMHAANPTCNSCHRMIDPIGLALENFDVSGGVAHQGPGRAGRRGQRFLRRDADRVSLRSARGVAEATRAADAHLHRESDGVCARTPIGVL